MEVLSKGFGMWACWDRCQESRVAAIKKGSHQSNRCLSDIAKLEIKL